MTLRFLIFLENQLPCADKGVVIHCHKNYIARNSLLIQNYRNKHGTYENYSYFYTVKIRIKPLT
jgi:hypothetical protein